MDQHRVGMTLVGDTARFGLKHMIPECFVSVKLETYEESSCSDLQQYSVLGVSSEDLTPSTSSIKQVQYQLSTMQQNQQGNQSRSSQGTSPGSQITHTTNTTHVSQPSSSVDRTTHQQPAQASTSLNFPHSHPRTSDVVWLPHSYIDPGSQHFHTHHMQYLPNDASLLASIPPTLEGIRSVKQDPEIHNGTSTVNCRTNGNPAAGSALPVNEPSDSNAFISYVLSPPRGAPTAGIFLFDPTRGLSSQGVQNQSHSSRDVIRNNVQSGRSVDNAMRENSSDSVSAASSPKPCESHLVSRSCQTVVTMSQIHDGPLIPGAKAIITDKTVPEVAIETEDTKVRVFNEAGAEESEGASSIDSESESVNLKRVTHVGSNCSEFGDEVPFSHQHRTQNCHGHQNQESVENGNEGHNNRMGSVSGVSSSHGSSTQHGSTVSSSRTNGSAILGNANFPFLDVDRPFRCDICGRTYTSQQALVNHERYHRGDRPYECEVCHKAFATNYHLVTHRRTHTGERPFQCQFCQRCFADRSAFVKHERTHDPNGSTVKRHKCDECGSGFTDSCGLKKHMRIHTGERPYVCDVCSKTFSTSSTFVAHKRIHTGERPYKCESCDKMFITKSHLLTHRRTHTGEKPFVCAICNRCFADGSSFRRHERLHRGENRHVCMHCGRGFPSESSLEKHKQTHVQTANFSYIYEHHDDLSCLSDQQQLQPNCDLLTSRSSKISIPHARENSDRSICVNLSRGIHSEATVNRNNLCATASREMNRESQSAHPPAMVSAREVA